MNLMQSLNAQVPGTVLSIKLKVSRNSNLSEAEGRGLLSEGFSACGFAVLGTGTVSFLTPKKTPC